MTSPFQDQKTFMRAMGNVVDSPDLAQAELYMKLTLEELGETLRGMNPDAEDTIDACILLLEKVAKFHSIPDTKQRVRVFDGVLDMIVTTMGIGISMDFPMGEGWGEVLRSNMAKIGPDGKVTKRSDGKVLKPDGWTGPDLETILLEHMTKRLEESRLEEYTGRVDGVLSAVRKNYYLPNEYMLCGIVTADRKGRFPDGSLIHTSRVIKEYRNDIFETKNSVYKVKNWE